MNFAILRTKKIKSFVAMRSALRHTFREQNTPNADPEKLGLNMYAGGKNTAESMEQMEKILPKKRRKDAVLCIEYLLTGSPERMNELNRAEQISYLKSCLQWVAERHDGNIVNASIHFDETTPHLHVYAVPIDEKSGRLNAKKFLGGRQVLRDMQTDFYEKVAIDFGFERGVEESRATHQTINEFYKNINTTQQKINGIKEQNELLTKINKLTNSGGKDDGYQQDTRNNILQ